jgi:hypothetical protein
MALGVISMRKALFLGVAWGFMFTGLVFGADSYSVRSIAGQAHRLGPAGQWMPVSTGDILSPSTIIRIGQNAVLLVADGETEWTLRSARQGTLESFLGAGSVGAEGRVSTGGRAVDSNVSTAVSGAAAIPAPPARAPEQDRELDWAE